MIRRLLAAALSLCIVSPALAATWTLDPAHTSVQFSVRHMMVSNVRGEFTKVSGTVNGRRVRRDRGHHRGQHRRREHQTRASRSATST